MEFIFNLFVFAIATVLFIFCVVLPYIGKFDKDSDVFFYEEGIEKLSCMIYLKKESYRVLDILAMVYYLPLWLIYGVSYVLYVAGKWTYEKLKSLMNITVFTKSGK